MASGWPPTRVCEEYLSESSSKLKLATYKEQSLSWVRLNSQCVSLANKVKVYSVPACMQLMVVLILEPKA